MTLEGVKKKLTLKQKLDRLGARVPLVEKMIFTRHLSLMIRTGFSLPQALSALKEQTKSAYFKDVIEQLGHDIAKGQLFSEALAKFPKVFSHLFTNMIKVGEASGNLEEVLNLLAEQLRKEHELKSRVKGAFMYPAVIFVAMTGVGIFMIVFIIPKLTVTLKSLNVPLPFSTQLIITVSDFLASHVILFFASLAIFIFGLVSWARSVRGHRVICWLLLNLPIVKDITGQINTARIARTFGSLLASGVSLVESLDITAATLENPYYQTALKNVAARIPKGEKLEKNFALYPKLFPPLITQMIGVGEETGSLTEILRNLAEFYEQEVDNATKNLGSILEPVLLIIIGSAVGFFVVSMLMPMFYVYKGI